MTQKKIEERLSRIQRFVDNWKIEGSLSLIERDIILEELRGLYTEVFNYMPKGEQTPANESVIISGAAHADENVEEHNDVQEAEVVDEPMDAEHDDESVVADVVAEPEVEDVVAPAIAVTHESVGDAFDDALDIDALLGLTGDDSIEEAERVIEESREEVARAAVAEEPVAEPETPVAMSDIPASAPVKEQPSVERGAVGGLFDIDDIPVRSRRGRKMISLYDAPTKQTPAVAKQAEPAAAPKEEPKVVVVEPIPAPVFVPAPALAVAPEPVVEPAATPAIQQPIISEPAPQRLGDVIAKNVTTLADKMAEEQPTAAFNRITDIRKAIGLNDKFLMIRDLFGGDANLYEDTITHLNEFDDLDECMIFIVENFRWNPDSEGAKLLVSLIERKLS